MNMPFPLSGGSYRFDHDSKQLVREEDAPLVTTDRTKPEAPAPVASESNPTFRRRKAPDTTED